MNPRFKHCLTLLLILMLLPLGVQAEEEEHLVCASFYPIWIFAKNILNGVDGITLECLTAPSTGCLHDYQLLTGDMMALHKADALLINGAGMEGYLDRVIDEMPELLLINASEGITLMTTEEDGEEEENAHIWLDPDNAIQMVKNLTEGLCNRYPDQAEKMRENAVLYIERLTKTKEDLLAGLSNLNHRQIITFHEAFPYFAKAFDLQIVAVVALEPEEPLMPATMMALCQKIRYDENGSLRDPLPPLFTEPQYSGKAALTLARETGADVWELDPVTTGDGALDSYETVMMNNLKVLQEALK